MMNLFSSSMQPMVLLLRNCYNSEKRMIMGGQNDGNLCKS